MDNLSYDQLPDYIGNISPIEPQSPNSDVYSYCSFYSNCYNYQSENDICYKKNIPKFQEFTTTIIYKNDLDEPDKSNLYILYK
jgi:hypothetical protein